MRHVHVWLTALGLGLMGLHFLGVSLPIHAWIDHWGADVGHDIRLALAATGVAVYSLAVLPPLKQPARGRASMHYAAAAGR